MMNNKQIGIFRIEAPLSDEGGMAVVYRARIENDQEFRHRNGRVVALKLARATGPYADQFEKLLRREISLLNDLRHPGIVRVLPIGARQQYTARAVELAKPNEIDKAPFYFIMELLDSTPLDKVIVDNRFTRLWRLELLYQMAITLDYLHLRRIGHRDLKPGNVLFRYTPDPNRPPIPVLIDFGLAETTRTELRAATVMYASPERLAYMGDNRVSQMTYIDHQADDIWALGVIAYQLLSQRYIFKGWKDQNELRKWILERDPDPLDSSIELRVGELIMGMLTKNPDHRLKIADIIKKLENSIELIGPRL